MAEAIAWASLPNIPRVMVDFVAGRPEIVQLLGGNFRHREARSAAAKRRSAWRHPDGLGAALREGYSSLQISPAVDANLSALDQPDTLAIVTGQQIGLYGGPLFTFLKALHTVLLANRLASEAPGAVVPVFWMETADADFGEVNRIAFPPTTEGPRRAVYTPHDVVAGKSISVHNLSDEIEEVNRIVLDWMAELPFARSLGSLIEQAYRPGRLMSAAFREVMNDILGEMGLILVDARHPAVSALTHEFWEHSLAHPEKLNAAFAGSSRDLEAQRLPLQVQLRRDALPVMHIGEDGLRKRILGTSGAWRIGSDGAVFDDEELHQMVVNQFDVLTPSALLRPLLQDWLLPTWIYVGGPAEVSYHAQVGRCYDSLGIPRPLISPRMSVTLVERSARRWLDKNSWSVADVLGGREILQARSGKAEALKELFDSGGEQMKSWLRRIEKAGDETGINLYGEIDQADRKIEHQWTRLRTVALHKLANQDQAQALHAEKLLDRFMPDGMLQERHSSALYFLAAYGRNIINLITNEINLFTPQHTVIDIEPVL